MAVFPNLKHDDCVQLCDCIRLDASKSVISAPHTEQDVARVEITADGVNYQLIHDSSTNRVYKKDWHLDWCYESKDLPQPPPIDLIDDNTQLNPNSATSISGSSIGIGQTWIAKVEGGITFFETNLSNLTATAGSWIGQIRTLDVDVEPTVIVATSTTTVEFGDFGNSQTDLVRFEFDGTVDPTIGSAYYFAALAQNQVGTVVSNFDSSPELNNQFRFSITEGAVVPTDYSFAFQSNSLSFRVGQRQVVEIEREDCVASPTVRITLADGQVFEKTSRIELKTAEQDCLFSDDNDLVEHEHDILEWLPEGRSSFIYVHRRAKSRIFSWLEERGFKDCEGKPFTKEDVLNREEFREWSRFLALRLIFGFISNSNGDVYKAKYDEYCKKEAEVRTRMYTLDSNGDGVDSGHHDLVNLSSGILVRG